MAKKNYQRLENQYEPSVNTSDDRRVTIKFRCKNSKGTNIDANIRIEKYWLPALIKEFARIARQDATNAASFAQRIKDAAQ